MTEIFSVIAVLNIGKESLFTVVDFLIAFPKLSFNCWKTRES